MLCQPLRKDDQCGSGARIIDREKGLQEFQGVASNRFRRKRRHLARRCIGRRGRAVSCPDCTKRLQPHHIAALDEFAPFDLATRHHATLSCVGNITKGIVTSYTGTSYAAARLSLTTLSFFIRWYRIISPWNFATSVISSLSPRNFILRARPRA